MRALSQNQEREPGPLSDRSREFVVLLGKHDRQLLHYILSLVPHFADAEELTQQVRILLWEQFDSYDRSKDFGKWSRAIAYYKVLAYRKQSPRKPLQLSDESLAALAAESEDMAPEIDEHYQALRLCLDQLNQAKRELLMRYYSHPGSMRELAEQLGRSFDSVRHSILRTRQALAQCIEKTLTSEGRP